MRLFYILWNCGKKPTVLPQHRFELMKVKDRRDSEFALGGTAEEMFGDLVRKYQLSYKDLPFQLYQFSPKFRG